jgi:DNA-binding transcriptional ArsR family regulator
MGMFDIAAIEKPAAAEASLDPIRARLLAELAEPMTGTALAGRLGMPRQRVNYHLRTLERHGLVDVVAEHRRGNVIERVVRATAASYVISPAVLGPLKPDPDRSPDPSSAVWLVSLASRLVQEMADLIARAVRAQRQASSFALETEVRFASPIELTAFTVELDRAVAALIARYDAPREHGGVLHRVLAAVHPRAARGERQSHHQ